VIDVTAMVDALLGEHCADCTSECCTRCVADYRLAGLLGEVGAAYGAGATISLIGDRHPAVMATLTPSQRRAAA
jgi:hypothetical protein